MFCSERKGSGLRTTSIVDAFCAQFYSEPVSGQLFDCSSFLVDVPLKTKKEIVKEIAEAMNISQTLAKEVVQRTLDSIVDGIVVDGRIELRKFGVFEVRERASKRWRNPSTGVSMQLPSKMVVTFKAGKEMEERVKRLSAKTLSEARDEGLLREEKLRESGEESDP